MEKAPTFTWNITDITKKTLPICSDKFSALGLTWDLILGQEDTFYVCGLRLCSLVKNKTPVLFNIKGGNTDDDWFDFEYDNINVCKIEKFLPVESTTSIDIKLFLQHDFEGADTQLSRLYSNLVNKQNLSDVIFNVKGTTFYALKYVLSERSDYFKAMFSGNFKENKDNTPIELDIDPMHFLACLHWIYTDKIPGLNSYTASDVISLYSVADYLLLEEIKKLCVRILGTIIDHDNFVEILVARKKYDISTLDECISKIIKSSDSAHLMKSIDTCGHDTLKSFTRLLLGVYCKKSKEENQDIDPDIDLN